MNNQKLTQTFAYFAAFVGLGMAMAALGPTIPGLAEQTHVKIEEISFLFTLRSFGFLLGSLFSGKFYDRRSGHKVMAVTILAMSVTLALLPMVSTLMLLLSVMLVLGIAEGAVGVGGNALLVWVHQTRVAPFMNALHFFYGVGGVLAPLLIKLVVKIQDGTTAPYFLLALLVLPTAFWLLILPSPQNPQTLEEQANAAPTNYQLVILIAVLLGLDIGAEVGYGGWIHTYVLKMNLGDQAVAANLTSLFWGALTAGRLLGVPLAARWRPRTILLADLIGGFLSLGVAIFWSSNLAMISVATVCIGLALASVYPMALTFAGRRMKINGQGMSIFLVGGSAGGMIVPLIIGQLFESIGPRVMMFTLLIDLLLAALIYAALIVGFPPKVQIKTEAAQATGKISRREEL
ncbi:MAG: MFS transporter [Acidobacteria bacterium]|nr:MFS transporter [Acidobacteriota bacterium]